MIMALAWAADDPFTVDPLVRTLPNGLRVVIERQDRTDSVAVHLHVAVGSRDETDGQRGMAHLFEHLMFEGSRNAPGNAYDELLTAAGGENNAFTSEDETSYQAVFPSGALERVLFLETDRLAFLGDGLTAEALENQKDVVLEERAQGYAAANGRDTDVLTRLLFPPGHPYHVPVIGSVAEVRAFDLQGVRAFHDRWYRPAHSVLAIVGNLEPATTMTRVEHWFSDVPVRPALDRPLPDVLPRRTEAAHGLLEDNVDDCTAYLAWVSPAEGTPGEMALLVAATILSDGRGTRLDRHYYGKGWIVESDANAWASELDGMFVVKVASSRKRLDSALRLMRREVEGLVRNPPTDAELKRARSRIRTWAVRSLEDPPSRAESMVDCLRLRGTVDCVASDWDRVRAVTAQDVRQAVSDLLAQPEVTLSVVPSGDASCALPGATPVDLP